jgi:PKD repeat protein
MASGVGQISYLWSWGDGSTDSIAYPNHVYDTAGLYTICCSITDSIGCTSSYCNDFSLQRITNTIVYVNVTDGISTGTLSINEAQPNFQFFPNPATNEVAINSSEQINDYKVDIKDITGRKVANFNLHTTNYRLDVANFANGVYLLTFEATNGKSVTKKLLISK